MVKSCSKAGNVALSGYIIVCHRSGNVPVPCECIYKRTEVMKYQKVLGCYEEFSSESVDYARAKYVEHELGTLYYIEVRSARRYPV